MNTTSQHTTKNRNTAKITTDKTK